MRVPLGMIEGWFPFWSGKHAQNSPFASYYYPAAKIVLSDMDKWNTERVLWAKEETPTDRGKMLALAWYYIWANERTIFAYSKRQCNGLDPAEVQWFGAMEIDIGKPLGPHVAEGSLYIREYEGATVIVKLRPRADSSIGPETVTRHPVLGGRRILRVDGSQGGPMESVNLRNNEAVILCV